MAAPHVHVREGRLVRGVDGVLDELSQQTVCLVALPLGQLRVDAPFRLLPDVLDELRTVVLLDADVARLLDREAVDPAKIAGDLPCDAAPFGVRHRPARLAGHRLPLD